MPKTKPPKNLVVDGTAKLAAKSKPSDKHEAPDLNIEEATVASPRPSRNRGGEFFDFDDGADAILPNKSAESKAAKPSKKTKTVPADEDAKSHGIEAKPTATVKRGKKGQGTKKEVTESPSEMTTQASEKDKRPRKPKLAKDELAVEASESSKKSKKATKELAGDKKPKTDAAPKTAKAETRRKAKITKAEKGAAEHDSSTVDPDVAMDEGPFETLLESNSIQTPEVTEEQSPAGPQATNAAKSAKKSAKKSTKVSKESKVESAKASAVEAAVNVADLTKKGAKVGTEKVKKSAKIKAPATETAADVANAVKAGVKAGTEKGKQAAKSMVPAVETPAVVADVVKKDAKASAEKIKKGAKLKDSKTTKNDESIKLIDSTEEPKPEASKSRKRKAPTGADAETLKTEILDPLSEHASAKKKQKKANTKSKSIGDTVGELLATATEGANAARASLGNLATSIMGGTSEVTEGATGAEKSAKTSAKKAKGKGKATAEDVTESSGKLAAIEESGHANPEDGSDDEPDDHTTALLAGLESDGDEGDLFNLGFQKNEKIPSLPKPEIVTKKLEEVKNEPKEGPGVVYVGRIPHGFYEHEMREYFSQFGDISRLRLSRSRKNGASKHYAFIEFTSGGVAQIVADTMHNYLMFGHILKCKVVPKDQLHEDLWKGAGRRFKAVPWNALEKRKLEVGLGREHWAERIEGEKKRRVSKNEKTKAIGYEFQASELKGVDQVPVREAATSIENGEKIEEERSLVTAGGENGNGAVVVSEEVKTKTVKKVKGKSEDTTTARSKKTKRALDEETAGSVAKKAKKGKNAVA